MKTSLCKEMLLAEANSVHELLQIVLQPGPCVSIGFEDVQQRVQHIGIGHSFCVLHALEPPDVVLCLLPQPAADTQHFIAGSQWTLSSPPLLQAAQHRLQPAPWPADTSLLETALQVAWCDISRTHLLQASRDSWLTVPSPFPCRVFVGAGGAVLSKCSMSYM